MWKMDFYLWFLILVLCKIIFFFNGSCKQAKLALNSCINSNLELVLCPQASKLQVSMMETMEAVELEKQKHNNTRMEVLGRLAKLEVLASMFISECIFVFIFFPFRFVVYLLHLSVEIFTKIL